MDIVRDARGGRIDTSPIGDLLGRMVRRWNPVQIWLFGSRSRGQAGPCSDWDLFVVVPDDLAPAELDPTVAWRLRRDSRAPADVVLCRASDFDEDRTTPNTLAYEAWTRGLLLYER
ncbi:MAG: nucleotidyltransferase domain-containing protein [Planctomycetes bacterium]|nr:nucleotidyltransferase domain-containing protein [Planctomycetota bacterium]